MLQAGDEHWLLERHRPADGNGGAPTQEVRETLRASRQYSDSLGNMTDPSIEQQRMTSTS